ncbi:ATP-dependent RNA helicase RhlB [Desulfonema ishimotonii]|uniref:ATP-dependent RNA helicase RhlB n=1 Tax=Desulfonema ishimotonii TaxID=45657 RepID=A0A401FT49_9BACT|nr:DEAD/DEAH box helicase [Desulfonema ishimotonii]GBC60141.1 ATP-dependent RNA helicase RhlB [Desulfonema ishimotonii]
MVKSFIKQIRNTLRIFSKADQKKKAEASDKNPARISADSDAVAAAPSEPSPPAKQVRPDVAETEPASPPKKRRRRRKKKKSTDKAPVPQTADLIAAHKEWDVSQFDVPPAEGKTRFHDLDLPGEILHAVADLGFQYCSPIQSEVLPGTLAGKDASGQAQTGTGKTAAFLITAFSHIIRNPIVKDQQPGTPRVLILAPTRELVIQIAEEARLLIKYYPAEVVTVFGGMDYQKQRRQLTEGHVDIVVGTPGRLIDFCQHDDLRLGKIEILIIDEADRLVDMGFMPQVRRIVRYTSHKDRRQTLFFSATMTGEVERLSSQWTNDPLMVEIEPEQVEVSSVEQIIYLITGREKNALLYNIITRQDLKRVIVFCNRRAETQRLGDLLARYGVSCAIISGDVPQKKRLRTLENFRAGNVRVLIATDVAGRGIHVEGISHVINYTIPHEPENYVHRIGRTGRAGATGTSISFACEEDSFYIPAIEEFLGHELHCSQPDEEWLRLPKPEPRKSAPRKQNSDRRRRRPSRPPGKPPEAQIRLGLRS